MEYFSIGKVVAAHGVDGRMILKHSIGKRTNLEGVEALFIEESPGLFVPWFLTFAKAKSIEETFIEVEGINSRESVNQLLRKELWLQEPDFKKHAGKNAPISFIGYDIFDKQVLIGKVAEVIEQPHQLLCSVMFQGKEVLIPVNDAFLLKVDHKKKILHMELPEGLLDVYLH
ncbi:MAG: 16S rRNA processing protein RimM [Chitinophagaceae bacterium]|nr:16S rRNA processing protein RimM [Chitinophagaceae bacterium]